MSINDDDGDEKVIDTLVNEWDETKMLGRDEQMWDPIRATLFVGLVGNLINLSNQNTPNFHVRLILPEAEPLGASMLHVATQPNARNVFHSVVFFPPRSQTLRSYSLQGRQRSESMSQLDQPLGRKRRGDIWSNLACVRANWKGKTPPTWSAIWWILTKKYGLR